MQRKATFKNIKIDLSDLNGGSNAGYFINNAGVISKETLLTSALTTV